MNIPSPLHFSVFSTHEKHKFPWPSFLKQGNPFHPSYFSIPSIIEIDIPKQIFVFAPLRIVSLVLTLNSYFTMFFYRFFNSITSYRPVYYHPCPNATIWQPIRRADAISSQLYFSNMSALMLVR